MGKGGRWLAEGGGRWDQHREEVKERRRKARRVK
jgi:hypothetical protein